MDNPLIIRTPQVIIRPWEMADASSIVKFANNPKIAENMRDGFPHPYTLTDAERFITMATTTTSALLLAIEVNGEAAGGIGVTPLANEYRKTADIGYWLAEPYWGKGIVTAAVKALIPIAFEHFDIVRIQAGVYSTNPASMRVLEKAGFEREAMHKKAVFKNGVVMDEIVFVRFREE